jgi:hypothetical protein
MVFHLATVQKTGHKHFMQWVACWAHKAEFADTFHTSDWLRTKHCKLLPSVFQSSLSHFCHICCSGSCQRSHRTLIICQLLKGLNRMLDLRH